MAKHYVLYAMIAMLCLVASCGEGLLYVGEARRYVGSVDEQGEKDTIGVDIYQKGMTMVADSDSVVVWSDGRRYLEAYRVGAVLKDSDNITYNAVVVGDTLPVSIYVNEGYGMTIYSVNIGYLFWGVHDGYYIVGLPNKRDAELIRRDALKQEAERRAKAEEIDADTMFADDYMPCVDSIY